MKLLGFYVTLSVFLCFNLDKAYGIECNDVVDTVLSGQMMNLAPCVRELGLETGQSRADNFHCIMRCMLRVGGILTQENEVTVRQAVAFVLENIPVEFMDKAFVQITKCVKHAGKSLVDPADVHCEKFGPLIGCSINVMLNLCK